MWGSLIIPTISLVCSSVGVGPCKSLLGVPSKATKPSLRDGRPSTGLNSKKARLEKRTIVCIDEAAFYLLPSVVRTWAPQGQTPVLAEVLGRDHLSAISAITPEGALYFHAQDKPLDGADVVRFLCHLLRQIPGKLLVLWDGSTIHYNEVVRRLLASDRNGDLWLERLPPYAPELNPDEGI